jgi:hypothetical protein
MARAPLAVTSPAGLATRPAPRARPSWAIGPAHGVRTPGTFADWYGGQSLVRLHELESPEAIASGQSGRSDHHDVARTGQVNCTWSWEDSPEPGRHGFVGLLEPIRPARSSHPTLESRQALPAFKKHGPDYPVGGPPGESRLGCNGQSEARPGPGLRDWKPLGRGATRRNKTLIVPETPCQSPICYGPASWRQRSRFTPLQFFPPMGSIILTHHHPLLRGDRASSVASFFCPPARPVWKWCCVSDRIQPGHPRLG